MGTHSISIVPKQSYYPDHEARSKEILTWLVSEDIVKPNLSDCILGTENGYAVSEGARQVSKHPEFLPFKSKMNGLEITLNVRTIFTTGETGIDELICPSCKQDIASEDWNFFNEWASGESNNLTCPLCNTGTDIHQYKFTPEWGFSNLGFTFWDWPELTEEFIEAFKNKLGCDVDVVYMHL